MIVSSKDSWTVSQVADTQMLLLEITVHNIFPVEHFHIFNVLCNFPFANLKMWYYATQVQFSIFSDTPHKLQVSLLMFV